MSTTVAALVVFTVALLAAIVPLMVGLSVYMSVDPNRLLIENRLPTEMVAMMMIYSIANERL